MSVVAGSANMLPSVSNPAGAREQKNQNWRVGDVCSLLFAPKRLEKMLLQVNNDMGNCPNLCQNLSKPTMIT